MSLVINSRYRVGELKAELLVGKLHVAYDLKNFCSVLVWLFRENQASIVNRFLLHIDSIPENNFSLRIIDKGFFSKINIVFIVYKYSDVISFSDYFHKETSVNHIIEFSNNLVSAINFFHSYNIVLGRLLPINILFNQRELKIITFGLDEIVKIFQIPDKYCSFLSPELIKGEKKERHSDYYAFGTILFYLLTNKYFSFKEFITFNDIYLFKGEEYTQDLRQLIYKSTNKLCDEREIYYIKNTI